MIEAILTEMRIKQWSKNTLVFAALLFSGDFFIINKLVMSVQMFLAFCLASSAVYFFNDIHDVDKDRKSPKNCNRPIASSIVGGLKK